MDRDTAEPVVHDMPGEKAKRWSDYHHQFSAPSTYVYDFVWDITEDAEGPFCTDVDGNVLMDFTSHVAAAPLGYNNPKIMDDLAEFDVVDPNKIAGQDFYFSDGKDPEDSDIPGPAHLMDVLTDVSSHYDMDTVFLSNSGAEAIENAMKICYDARDGAKYAITFDGAFHGRTLGALSMNRSKSVYRKKFPELPGVHDVPYCAYDQCSDGDHNCGFFPAGEDEPSLLRKKLDPKRGHIDPDEVAFILMEPIQGEGGYRFPTDAFAQEIQDLCVEHGIPLIADEIQAGVGRTGEMWGSDHYPFEPDVITGAKGLRVGATISNSAIFPSERGRLSSTWGAGDVLSSLQGALTLRAIDEYDLMANAKRRYEQFADRMADADLPGVVDARGKGLMLAVEFDEKVRREAVVEECLHRGLLTLGCGYSTIRLLPPLDVTEREMNLALDLFEESVQAVEKDHSVAAD